MQLKYFLPIFALFSSSFLHAQYLVGYWQNWGGSDYIDLEDVDTRYNVVNLSFAVPGGGTDYDMTFTPCCGETTASIAAKIDLLQSYGVTVNLSIGGGGTPIILDNTTERDVFISSMNNLVDALGVDGIDIDLENASLTVSASSTIANPTDANIVNMIYAINAIKDHYALVSGQNMFLSFAPETAFVQGGQSTWGGIWGAYLPVLHALRNDIDLIHVQLYNSGSMYGPGGGIYNSGTADFIVAMTESLVLGFNVPLATNAAGHFDGFPASKIGIGLPACPQAAGSGFIPTTVVKQAIDYLMGNGPKPGTYTLQNGPYPDLAGMMTWSVNWDASTTCNATAWEFATNYALIFQTGICAQPDLGSDVNACEITFPHTLQSNTSTGPGILYTWINLTTNQVMVSNSSTATSIDVNIPGEYKVIRTDGTCSKSDQMLINSAIPVPDLLGPATLCAGVPLTISIQNSAFYPVNTQWQWYKDQQAIAGETNTAIATVSTDGTYTLEAILGNCQESDDHIVASDLPTALNDCIGPGEMAMLGLANTGAGPYLWYDQPAGGAQVHTGTSYTTPILNATTSWYVADQNAVFTTFSGPPLTGNGLGALQNYKSPDELYFDAAQAFTIKEMTFYPLIWGYTHPFNIQFTNAAGTPLVNGTQNFMVTHPGPFGALMGPVTLVMSGGGVQVPAGTGFKIIVSSTVGCDHWLGTTFPKDYNPYFTLTGSDEPNKCLAVHDWLIEIAGCAYRVPVTATVDPACAAALPLVFTDFSVHPGRTGHHLQWRVEGTEMTEIMFEIERKTNDSDHFERIETINAHAAPGIQAFQYLDKNIDIYQTNYYRVALVDSDGTRTYTPVRSARYGATEPFTTAPNPAQDMAWIYGNAPITGIVQVFTPEGTLLRSISVAETSAVRIDLLDLPSGIYHLRVTETGGAVQYLRVCKARD